MPNATDAATKRQLPSGPPYRVIHGSWNPEEWIVASGTPDDPGPALMVGFKTEKAAQEAADTLNGLEADGGRRDEVLGRMLKPPRN